MDFSCGPRHPRSVGHSEGAREARHERAMQDITDHRRLNDELVPLVSSLGGINVVPETKRQTE